MAITITQADIEGVFGAVFVAQWSSFSQGKSPVVDTTRINTAIANGQAHVNGRLGTGPYNTPLTALDPTNPPPEIVDAMATYAGWWLWRTRGLNYAKETIKWMTDTKAANDRTLQMIRVGNYPVACALNSGRRQIPQVV